MTLGNPVTDLSLTLMPLDVFREIIGINPYHFWQLDDPQVTGTPDYGDCEVPFVHYRWLVAKGVGRHDLLRAVALAESKIANVLGFWLGRKYTADESYPVVKSNKPYIAHILPGLVTTRWKHIYKVGTLTTALILAGVALTIGATDDVTATVTVVAGTTASEIMVCYPGTTTAIRPVSITVTGTTATITFKKWLCSNPTLWSRRITGTGTYQCVPPNIITTVDVYRNYIDETNPLSLVWGASDPCSVTPCSSTTVQACISTLYNDLGCIKWNPISSITSLPDYIRFSYMHGVSDGDEGINTIWASAITHFAAGLLDDIGCDCQDADFLFSYWQQDLAQTTPTGGSHQLNASKIGNLLGTKRGAIEAWQLCQQLLGS